MVLTRLVESQDVTLATGIAVLISVLGHTVSFKEHESERASRHVKALQLTLPLAPVRWHFVSQSVDAAFPISSDPIMTLDVQAVRGQEYLGFSPKAGGDLASAMRYPDYRLQQPVHAVGCWHLPAFVHAALACSAAEGMVLHLFACPAPFGGPFLPVPRLHAAVPLRVIMQSRFQQLLLLDSRLHGSAAIIAVSWGAGC